MNVSADLSRVFELQSKQQWVNKASPAAERIRKLRSLKDCIMSREADVQEALALDLRRDASGAQEEIASVYGEIEHAIECLHDWMSPVDVEPSAQFAGCRARITREARGIVLLFGPWNFPFNLVFQPITSIIAAGNCALVKPNEMAPNTSKVTAEIIREAFSEKDVAVFEGGVGLANELLEMPINHVFFTGSPAVGKVVMAAAAKHLASVTLELGGKNPVIIDRTANLQATAENLAVMRNINGGQVCLCPENIWLPAEQEQEFIGLMEEIYQAMFYENDKLNLAAMGRIVDKRNFDRVKGYIDDAKARGANIVVGGDTEADTLTIHPTIMTKVPVDSMIMQEETFGPILNVLTYGDVDEVISSVRKQPKPLAMYLFTQDEAFIEKILQATSSGGVTVNNCILHALDHNLPFGGVNNSGMGSYHGVHGFNELSHHRSVLMM